MRNLTMKQATSKYKIDLFTGIRPTGDLTIANYTGAVKPLLNLQTQGLSTMVFVADLHALTDHELSVAEANTLSVVADYIALGLDPKKTEIFVQSNIATEVYALTNILLKHVTISELLRVPTLKDKLKGKKNLTEASALLTNYPVLMAADILLQRARYVPVGEDQLPHIELTRTVAKRFNNTYREILPLPTAQKVKPLRIRGLDGASKMSKTDPNQAIFLGDSPEEVKRKVRKAKTAFEKEMPDVLKSHIELIKSLTDNSSDLSKLDKIIESHMAGEKVMGDFKELMAKVIIEFLDGFQKKKKEILVDSTYIPAILEKGFKSAKKTGQETLELVYSAMREKK
jgi:tryptophanyl-tRNA synthetase